MDSDNSEAATLTATPASPLSVSVTASVSTICEGETAIFTAETTNAGPSPTYQWQLNGTSVGTDTPTWESNALADGDVVTCLVVSSEDCPSNSPAISTPISMAVNSSLEASISLEAINTAICEGEQAVFIATPTNGGSSPDYEWRSMVFHNRIRALHGRLAC